MVIKCQVNITIWRYSGAREHRTVIRQIAECANAASTVLLERHKHGKHNSYASPPTTPAISAAPGKPTQVWGNSPDQSTLMWHLQKAHRVELRWAEARTKFYKAMWEAALAFACVDAAEVDVRDAKIARLQRQLKVARGRKKLRRGWSTTRVRFML